MSLQVPHPLIAQAIHQDSNGLVNIILTDDNAHQAEVLYQSVRSSLLSGAHCYIVVSEHAASIEPVQMLSQFNLAHLSADLQSLSSVNQDILARSKSLESLQRIPIESNRLAKLKINRDTILDQIKEQLARFQAYITPQETFKDHILNVEQNEGNIASPLVQELITWDIDYTVLRGFSTLGELYDSRFSFVQKEMIPSWIFNNEDSHRSYVNQVRKTKGLVDAINAHLSQLTTELTHNQQEQLQSDIDHVENVKIELVKYLPLSELDSAGDRYLKIQKIIAPLQSELYQLAIPSFTERESITHIIDQLDTVLLNSESIKVSTINALLNRVTPFNATDDRLDSINIQLAELRAAVDTIAPVKEVIKKRYFNLATISADCTAIANTIDHLLTVLTNDQYCNYRLLKAELNCTDSLVKALLSQTQSDWGEALLTLYIQGLQSNRSILIHEDHELISKYGKHLRLCRRIQRTESEILHNRWADIRSEALNRAGGKTVQQLSHSVSTDSMLHVLTQYFPIKITTPEELDHHEVKADSKIIFLNNGNANVQRLQELSPNHHIVILGSILRNINRVQEHLSTQVLQLETSSIQRYKPFGTMQSSDRLAQAKSLALAINMICDRFDVIQLRDKSVISLCNKTLSQKIIDMLPEHQVILLYQNSSQYEDLVDAMIHEDREIYILHENGLLDERRLAHLDWQLDTIEQINHTDIRLINITTSQLTFDLEATLMNVFNAIVSFNTTGPIYDEISDADEPTTVPI